MCNCFMYGVMCIMFGFDDDLLRVITGKLKINLIALFNTNSNGLTVDLLAHISIELQ